jgi:hypothetical protein
MGHQRRHGFTMRTPYFLQRNHRLLGYDMDLVRRLWCQVFREYCCQHRFEQAILCHQVYCSSFVYSMCMDVKAQRVYAMDRRLGPGARTRTT